MGADVCAAFVVVICREYTGWGKWHIQIRILSDCLTERRCSVRMCRC